MKGSDYRMRKAAKVVVDGGNPYAKPMSKYTCRRNWDL